MNRKELVAKLSEVTKYSEKECEAIERTFEQLVGETLANGEKIALSGFGTFEPRERAEREGHNPRTKEKIIIPATIAPAFKAGKTLKKIVKGE